MQSFPDYYIGCLNFFISTSYNFLSILLGSIIILLILYNVRIVWIVILACLPAIIVQCSCITLFAYRPITDILHQGGANGLHSLNIIFTKAALLFLVLPFNSAICLIFSFVLIRPAVRDVNVSRWLSFPVFAVILALYNLQQLSMYSNW